MRQLLVLIVASCVLASCNKDNPSRDTFISYSLNGPTCNGLFSIQPDKDVSTLEASAILLPATADDPEVAVLTFQDYTTARTVAFTIPVSGISNPYVLLHDSEFGMAITHQDDECTLTSGVENTVSGVSIDIKNFKKGSGIFGFSTLEYLEVHFIGIMTFKNEMNEVEQHTVAGDFVFNADDMY